MSYAETMRKRHMETNYRGSMFLIRLGCYRPRPVVINGEMLVQAEDGTCFAPEEALGTVHLMTPREIYKRARELRESRPDPLSVHYYSEQRTLE